MKKVLNYNKGVVFFCQNTYKLNITTNLFEELPQKIKPLLIYKLKNENSNKEII
ncbi:hypothetical protein [Candidatus Phytoplasma solani]|uniref:hypothetical protein n=1 Tax=Candidatus Phytoplasma solani TaxID=69896 RepID=UPI0032DBC03E